MRQENQAELPGYGEKSAEITEDRLHRPVPVTSLQQAICGVQVSCLSGPDGAKLLGAFWKIAVPPLAGARFEGFQQSE